LKYFSVTELQNRPLIDYYENNFTGFSSQTFPEIDSAKGLLSDHSNRTFDL
jgi:hypothetical protein